MKEKLNVSLCITLVDYKKDFDLVETQAVLRLLQEYRIYDEDIKLQKDIYTNRPIKIHLGKEGINFATSRRIPHGENVSPNLFTQEPTKAHYED